MMHDEDYATESVTKEERYKEKCNWAWLLNKNEKVDETVLLCTILNTSWSRALKMHLIFADSEKHP